MVFLQVDHGDNDCFTITKGREPASLANVSVILKNQLKAAKSIYLKIIMNTFIVYPLTQTSRQLIPIARRSVSAHSYSRALLVQCCFTASGGRFVHGVPRPAEKRVVDQHAGVDLLIIVSIHARQPQRNRQQTGRQQGGRVGYPRS